jgi:hypothetical protein
MRPFDDPDVQQVAARLAEGNGVVPWPDGVATKGACACLLVSRTAQIWFAYAPDHECDNAERLRLNAARVLWDFADSGPDEGWRAFDDGSGWITWLSTPAHAARQQGAVIPVSEMPPLD